MIEITHQGRAGPAAGDALGRAAHIDVDDIRAGVDGHPGGLAHPARLTTGELHDMRSAAGRFGPQARLFVACGETIARYHLGNHQACALALGNAAHHGIRHAGHRRQDHRVCQLDRPDPQPPVRRRFDLGRDFLAYHECRAPLCSQSSQSHGWQQAEFAS